MPIYEYQCRTCERQFEVLQKIDEAALCECPTCKTSTLEKKISAAGFQLKGTGWYVTDFKDSKSSKNNSTDKTAPKPSVPPTSEKKEA